MDIVTLGAALNGSAEYVNSHFKGGSNIQIVDNPDGTQTINASGEVSSEDTVARAEIAEMKDGTTLDSFGDVETALATKADSSTTYTKTEVDTALSAKANSADVYSKTAVDTALGNKADKSTTYTKTEVDTALSAKADKSTTYTKTEVDTALDDKVDKETGKGLSTNDYTNDEKTKLATIAEGAEVNVQSNWTQSSTTADDYIKNKPTLGTAAALDVAVSGNASTSQVVKGNDTRLTDARNAADVSSWAKAANKPSYNGSEIALTGYAEAQSKSNVAATDTTNAAIGKLEYRVETNENNISSLNTEIDAVANLGAKNLLDFETWASNITVYNGTKSYSNGVLTVTATGSDCTTYYNQYFPEVLKIPVKEGEKYIITWDTTATTNIGFLQLCPNGNTISGTDVNIANKQTEYTVPSGATYLTYRVGVWASGDSINISKLMLRPASISDSTYQPYAMSNIELTNGILNWSKSENRLLSSQVDVNTMFDADNSSVYVYTNEILRRVVIAISLKVKTAISSPYSTIALAELPHTHYPIVSINTLTSNFRLTKNDMNSIIAFAALADVAVGTVLKQQLEYTYY